MKIRPLTPPRINPIKGNITIPREYCSKSSPCDQRDGTGKRLIKASMAQNSLLI
ncbi:hypothetical protein SEET0012_08685 [Salmonella enterica subsp. enterica serovar Tallahassee str. 0012]|nr:hypothetical protein SEET0012_08685 [Salmonella enterica subsp. enterica serovar Tallahassee str. 0012]